MGILVPTLGTKQGLVAKAPPKTKTARRSGPFSLEAEASRY